MDILTESCSPTMVVTANGEVQTHEEAIVYVKELDIFLTMKVLEKTPAILSIQITTTQKFLQIHMKNKRHNRLWRFLQPDPRQKQKPQKRETAESPSTIPMNERKWIDIGPAESSLSAYELSKNVISLLRHNKTVQREEDGAIQFRRIKFHLRNQFSQISCWTDERWKVCLAAGWGWKWRYQYCSDNSGTILYLRALQGHSGSNLIDPLLQDNVIIQSGFFQTNFSRRMCVQSSFYHQ